MQATRNDAVTPDAAAAFGLRGWTGWVLGPAVLLATLVLPPPGG